MWAAWQMFGPGSADVPGGHKDTYGGYSEEK
ncbi:unannotated protein [freshwater metagenome]|uniref:Unannotated protein n=1 Tax=freshwater metagenome TaxID=449393 RepID=A0A6J6JN51_9ZZZZ